MAQIQPRNNTRAQPTLDVRNVKYRYVAEAYDKDNVISKGPKKKLIICVLAWAFFVIGLITVSLLTFPPTLWGLFAELALGVLISNCIVVFFLRSN